MGNMHGWGGIMSDDWHKDQVELQHKILQRMRNFGIIPVVPAFGGSVPESIARIFPNVSLTKLSDWGSFNATYCWYEIFIYFHHKIFFQHLCSGGH